MVGNLSGKSYIFWHDEERKIARLKLYSYFIGRKCMVNSQTEFREMRTIVRQLFSFPLQKRKSHFLFLFLVLIASNPRYLSGQLSTSIPSMPSTFHF